MEVHLELEIRTPGLYNNFFTYVDRKWGTTLNFDRVRSEICFHLEDRLIAWFVTTPCPKGYFSSK